MLVFLSFVLLLGSLVLFIVGLTQGRALRTDLADGSVCFKLSKFIGVSASIFAVSALFFLAALWALGIFYCLSTSGPSDDKFFLIICSVAEIFTLTVLPFHIYKDTKKFFVNSIHYRPEGFTVTDIDGSHMSFRYEEIGGIRTYEPYSETTTIKLGWHVDVASSSGRKKAKSFTVLKPIPIEPLQQRGFIPGGNQLGSHRVKKISRLSDTPYIT